MVSITPILKPVATGGGGTQSCPALSGRASTTRGARPISAPLRKDAAALGKARLDQWKAMRARDESKKNEIMGFLESQQSEFGQGKKKRHKK